MTTVKRSFLCLLSITLLACGGGSQGEDAGTDGGDLPCSPSNPCPEGQSCNSDQSCVEVDPLQIDTDSLPEGRVDFSYDLRLQASGGLTPYSWTIVEADDELTWLSLSSSGRLSGTPDQVVIDASVTVQVEDAATDEAAQTQATLSLSIILCQDGDRELCYVPADGICTQGVRLCTDGVMGECTSNGNPSGDALRCGPACEACDSAVTDSCTEGLCTCGGEPPCSGGLRCCAGQCIDTSADPANCGSCFLDCQQAVAHVSETAVIDCMYGSCVFEGECEHGFLNCDEIQANGCELPITLVNCGECDLDCNDEVGHVSASQRTCTDTGEEGAFICGFEGVCNNEFADCDTDTSNGCEVYLNSPNNCGGCDVNCSESGVGELCVSPNPSDLYFHECGCRFDTATGLPEGCGAGQLCCTQECTDCARHCFEGASDPNHCGVCDGVCESGGTCNNGACSCSQGSCPETSSATTCTGGNCVCAEYGDGSTPCPMGYFCCDGNQGGSGGSAEGDPDIGCCRKRCGQNDAENFPCSH